MEVEWLLRNRAIQIFKEGAEIDPPFSFLFFFDSTFVNLEQALGCELQIQISCFYSMTDFSERSVFY